MRFLAILALSIALLSGAESPLASVPELAKAKQTQDAANTAYAKALLAWVAKQGFKELEPVKLGDDPKQSDVAAAEAITPYNGSVRVMNQPGRYFDDKGAPLDKQTPAAIAQAVENEVIGLLQRWRQLPEKMRPKLK